MGLETLHRRAQGARTRLVSSFRSAESLDIGGLRDWANVLIGGAPTTRAWADQIRVDGYAEGLRLADGVVVKEGCRYDT